MDKKSVTTIITLTVVIIAIILIINYVKGNYDGNEDTMTCIAEKSTLIVKEGCSRCAAQKQILGNHLNKFEVVDCAEEENIQKCVESGVRILPGWIIGGEKHEEIFSIEELKKLTGC